MRTIRPLAASLALAVPALLTGCMPAHIKRAQIDLPCPAPGKAEGGQVGPALFVVTTNQPECREGLWTLSRERGPGSSYGLARSGEKQWDIGLAVEDRWLATLKAQAVAASKTGTPRVLVYIHGFNNSPDLALARAKRVAEDASFKGPVVALLWPSQKSLLGYDADEANNEWSHLYANDLLRKLAAAGLDIVLVSHSMGNRIAAEALARMMTQSRELASRVRTVVLAAPDLDGGMFDRDFARNLAAPDRRVTIYASTRDRALASSSALHGYRRVGDLRCTYAHRTGPVSKTERCYPLVEGATGLRVIDTSAVSFRPIGHSDFIDSPQASADLCRVINGLDDNEKGRSKVPGYPGIYALDPDVTDRSDCPDEAPPVIKKDKRHHKKTL